MSEPLDLDALRATCEKIAKALPSTETPRTILALLDRLEAAERDRDRYREALADALGVPFFRTPFGCPSWREVENEIRKVDRS